MTSPVKPEDLEALAADFTAFGLRELHIRCDELEIYLSNDSSAPGLDGSVGKPPTPAVVVPATATAPAGGQVPRPDSAHAINAPGPSVELPEGAVLVEAPYMGTFYRAPKPGAEPYVEIGSEVTPETDLCLVEVMKLFTAVRSPVAGRIHAIFAVDGHMVEANQPLFAVIST